MKKAVINFARGGWYPHGQQRLLNSLKQTGFDGDLLCYQDEAQIGAPPHFRCPYAFKPYALLNAVQRGYTHVLWCDAAVWAIRSIEPIFGHIDAHGHMFFMNGCVGEWSSDACLETFGITRDEAMKITELMGCCMGFNMTSPITQKFLEEWLKHANDGKSFPGDWTNQNQQVSRDPRVRGHRHDQTVGSIIAWALNMALIVAHENFFDYYRNPKGGQFDGDLTPIKPHILMLNQGMML